MDFKSKRWRLCEEIDEPYPGPDIEKPTIWEVFQDFAEVMLEGSRSVTEAMEQIYEQLGVVPPLVGHQWHYHQPSPPGIPMYEDRSHVLAGMDAFKEIVDAVEPIIEITEGHHAVCKHKPRCKKPPAYVELNKPAGKKRREKIFNR